MNARFVLFLIFLIMTSGELREKFLKFFETRGHKILPSASLIPKEDDPSVLFNSAGMQQFKRWYTWQDVPKYSRVTTCQKCIRTSDIEEVGDDTHVTFLEMLGNFSFGDPAGKPSVSNGAGYFKRETIGWGLEFLTKEMKLDRQKITATIFKGDNRVPRDEESHKILKNLGFKDSEIKECGREDNFWGPTGSEGPCGPTVEFYFNGVEIWNLVFNEYFQTADKKLKPLEHKGVDTGMGLERLLAAVNGKKNIYETDIFQSQISNLKSQIYNLDIKIVRKIVDHIKAAAFLLAENIIPSNKEQGYILRTFIRTVATLLGRCFKKEPQDCLLVCDFNAVKIEMMKLVDCVVKIYGDIYPELRDSKKIKLILCQELDDFFCTLKKGDKYLKNLLEKYKTGAMVSGKDLFELHATYGLDFYGVKDLLKMFGRKTDEKGFAEEFQKHREISRAGIEKKFKGGLVEQNAQTIKLHTATHLLHAALRLVLGKDVHQMGSNITSERLRFDFSYPQKMTPEQIEEVEKIVNDEIAKNLVVECQEKPYKSAIAEGALAFFREKYPEVVKVYTIGSPVTGTGRPFSVEVCGGPHVKNLKELGKFKIKKEEAVAKGIRRIKAILQ